jgi:hypothetical protein
MNRQAIYEISRYGVATHREELIERAELFRDEGRLTWRLNEGSEAPRPGDGMAAAFAGVAELREIRPDQVTRVTAVADVENELPLLLRPTGESGDIDESLWSEEMSIEHLDAEVWSVLPFDSNRALYVNGQPWRSWHTTGGDQILPEHDMEPRLTTKWAEVSLYESATMNSGGNRSVIGLVTPNVIAKIYTTSGDWADEDDFGSTITLSHWDGSPEACTAAVADWILSSPVSYYFYKDGNFVDPKFFVQLFIDAALISDDTHTSRFAENLIDSCGYDMDYFDRGDITTEFDLDIHVGRDVIDGVLDGLAGDEPEYADMIAAARDPDSAEARARDARRGDTRRVLRLTGLPSTTPWKPTDRSI